MKAERDELAAIHERYARRTLSYEPWAPWVWRTHRALELALIQLLRRHRFLPAADTRLLEVGCGGGANLQMFLRLGFRPNNLAGIELQSDRAAAARQLLPANVKIWTGDASTLEVPSHSFDIVFQSLVFTSILDDSLQERLANKMISLVKPGGGVVWYDFSYNNPSNPDVRGVPLSRVRQLFHGREVHSRKVTLAPPIARVVTRVWPPLYNVVSILPFLRTHLLCWVPAERGRS